MPSASYVAADVVLTGRHVSAFEGTVAGVGQ
jgi:hypothetical protein